MLTRFNKAMAMFNGTFLDPTDTHPHLKGKTALLQPAAEGQFLAQFDDMTVPEAHGWHGFPADSFRVHSPVEWE